MVFNFFRAVQSQSIYWLSLDQFVDEVGCFETPSGRHLILLYLDLFGEDVVSDLLSVLPNVRPLAVHALISDHSNSKVVHGHTVVLSAHNLRSHVARGT